MNRKRLVLAALLGLLAVCLVYAYLASPRLEKAPPRSASQQARPVKDSGNTARADSGTRIDFAFLSAEAGEFPGAKRNIFRFGIERSTKPKSKAPVATTSAPKPIEDIPVVEEITPIAVVQKSLSRFTFLGFLDKAGEKTVFLSSGGDLYLVKQGETFGADREFYINEIEGNFLRVSHSGRNDLIEIPLIEQQKLNASVSAPVSLPRAAVNAPPGRSRVFKSVGSQPRPVVAPESEEPFRELIEEYNPEEQQEPDEPAEGDVPEGEVNGTNQ